MRMQVAGGTTGDDSLVELSSAAAPAMGLEAGGHVTLRWPKQRRTTSVVVVDEKLAEGEARLSATAQANIATGEGDDVSTRRIEHARRVRARPSNALARRPVGCARAHRLHSTLPAPSPHRCRLVCRFARSRGMRATSYRT